MENNNNNNNNNILGGDLVSENPSPPFYYKYFTNVNSLLPPPLPIEGSSTLSLQYNGIVASQLIGNKDYDNNKNYKNELKNLMEKLLIDSLSLVETTSSREPLRNYIENLESTINSIYICLCEYRKHEAREHLINEMNEQLYGIKQIETKLKRYFYLFIIYLKLYLI